MKLVFFSGNDFRSNRELYEQLKKGTKKSSVAYIPAWYGKESEKDFKSFKKRTRQVFKNHHFCPVDQELSKKEIKFLLSHDVIFIDGGNTFLLLSWLKKNNLMKPLKNFAKRKTLAGLSAGAIVMTHNIKLAEIPSFTADDNEPKVKDLRSLALTNFEFSPHYEGSNKEDWELCRYSRKIKRPIYACCDKTGIVVKNGKIEFSGDGTVVQFYKGIKYYLEF